MASEDFALKMINNFKNNQVSSYAYETWVLNQFISDQLNIEV